MASKLQQRRATSAEWAAANPILADGEIGFERDTKIIKMGDGVTRWNALGMPNVQDAVPRTLVDAKGDILVGTSNDALARLPVGTNGQVITADSTAENGLAWKGVFSASRVGATFTVPGNSYDNVLLRIPLGRKATSGIVAFSSSHNLGAVGIVGPTIDDGKSIASNASSGGSVPGNNILGVYTSSANRAQLWSMYLDTVTNDLVIVFRNYNASSETFAYSVNWILF